jgi:hypothetical protein
MPTPLSSTGGPFGQCVETDAMRRAYYGDCLLEPTATRARFPPNVDYPNGTSTLPIKRRPFSMTSPAR